MSRQSITAEDLTQRTQEANKWAREKFATFKNGPIFTPPAYNQETVALPGFSGGNEWGGMSFDPKLKGYIYDPRRARELLAQAGYPGGRGLPPIPIWSAVKLQKLLQEHEQIKKYLAAVGIQ